MTVFACSRWNAANDSTFSCSMTAPTRYSQTLASTKPLLICTSFDRPNHRSATNDLPVDGYRSTMTSENTSPITHAPITPPAGLVQPGVRNDAEVPEQEPQEDARQQHVAPVGAVVQHLARHLARDVARPAPRGNHDVQQRDHRVGDQRGDQTEKDRHDRPPVFFDMMAMAARRLSRRVSTKRPSLLTAPGMTIGPFPRAFSAPSATVGRPGFPAPAWRSRPAGTRASGSRRPRRRARRLRAASVPSRGPRRGWC